MIDALAVLATATRHDRAVDMSRAERLVGRAVDADVGREARLFHSIHIVTVHMLPTERTALVTGLCDGNQVSCDRSQKGSNFQGIG
jgi:hypothetical protein